MYMECICYKYSQDIHWDNLNGVSAHQIYWIDRVPDSTGDRFVEYIRQNI